MKKLLGIVVLGLLLSSCGERAEYVPPKEGLFPNTKTNYGLYCEVRMGPDQNLFKFDLSFDENDVFINIHQSKKIFLAKDINNNDFELSFYLDGDEDYFYYDKLGGYDEKDRMWMLDKKSGDFWAGLGEVGSCIENGCGWRLNKDENKFEYHCDQ